MRAGSIGLYDNQITLKNAIGYSLVVAKIHLPERGRARKYSLHMAKVEMSVVNMTLVLCSRHSASSHETTVQIFGARETG